MEEQIRANRLAAYIAACASEGPTEEQKLLGPRPAQALKGMLAVALAYNPEYPGNVMPERWISTKELAEEFPRPAKAELEKAK